MRDPIEKLQLRYGLVRGDREALGGFARRLRLV